MPFEDIKLLNEVTNICTDHKLFSFETIKRNWEITVFLIQQDVPKSKPKTQGEKILDQHVSGFAFLKKSPLYI